MGLDKGCITWLHDYVMEKLPHKNWGSGKSGVMGYITRALGLGVKKRVSPATQDAKRFERDAREQFVQLKNKGLSIPVFTLWEKGKIIEKGSREGGSARGGYLGVVENPPNLTFRLSTFVLQLKERLLVDLRL